MSDEEVRTVEDARNKARTILHVRLLNTEVFFTDSGGWSRPLPEEVERIVTVVSDWLWGV
jgi:hypothetical protein